MGKDLRQKEILSYLLFDKAFVLSEGRADGYFVTVFDFL